MFDLSWTHILIVLVVALLVVGPKDLPRMMHTVGKWVGKARGMADQFRKSFDDMTKQAELDELRDEINALRNERPLAGLANDMHQSILPPVDLPAPNTVPPITGTAPQEGVDPKSSADAAAAGSVMTGTAPQEKLESAPRPAEEIQSAMIARTPEDEADIEKSKAPLLEHLIELRKRLVWSVITFIICFVICFAFAKQIYGFLTAPLAHALAGQPNDHLIYTALYETFFTYVKVGMFAGLCLAFPIIATQLYLFIAPGLYKNERKAFLPFLFATPFLFIAGAAFVYYIMLPFAIRFFVSYQTAGTAGGLGIQLQAKVSEYLDFITTLIFAFGLTFQMPVLLSLLGRVGIITAKQLSGARRYAIVGITVLAAVLTPPDAISMFSLMVPLVFLYEVSIICVKLIERGRAKEEAAKAAAP